MYGKIFASIYDGSMYGNWQAIVTFQQMIVLCGPDGIIDMTPQALAARTSIPLDVIQQGISVLESPDQYSRSPDQDGRRIERIDDRRPWGWRIVNYRKYRLMVSAEEKRESDRIRIATKRDKERQNATGCDMSQVSQVVADVAQAEAEVEVIKPLARRKRQASESFERFWTAYPRKASKGSAEKAWSSLAPDEQLVGRILAAIERARTSEQWRRDGGQFIPYPATWLRAKGWEDGETVTKTEVPAWMKNAI